MLAVVSLALVLGGCITVDSAVRVRPLDVHQAYRDYTDSVISSGRLSEATRQALSLVPKTMDAHGVDEVLRALGDSPRIDRVDQSYARAELALLHAEALAVKDPKATPASELARLSSDGAPC
jgi:hypothetical protein